MKKNCIFKFFCILCVLTLSIVNFSVTAFAEYDYEIVEVEGEQCSLFPGPEVFSDLIQNSHADETDGTDENNENKIYIWQTAYLNFESNLLNTTPN